MYGVYISFYKLWHIIGRQNVVNLNIQMHINEQTQTRTFLRGKDANMQKFPPTSHTMEGGICLSSPLLLVWQTWYLPHLSIAHTGSLNEHCSVGFVIILPFEKNALPYWEEPWCLCLSATLLWGLVDIEVSTLSILTQGRPVDEGKWAQHWLLSALPQWAEKETRPAPSSVMFWFSLCPIPPSHRLL